MAQSNVGGAFGFLRKSIGSIVYSTSTASLSGEKKQVARSKPSSVRNPRTLSQIVQRMKVGPAQLFYAAFEKAAGSMENNPLSHSWQGVPYGPKSRTKFLQLAMTGYPKAYVPKGINFPVPGVYQVSQGSLPSFGLRKFHENGVESSVVFDGNEPLTQAGYDKLLAQGIQAGDQITIMYLREEESGIYTAHVSRLIVAVGNSFSYTEGDTDDWKLYEDGFSDPNETIACVAFIVSRGTSPSTAKRSSETMMLTPGYADLMSPAAYDAAVDSYIENIEYNSLNSDWYLNQGSRQAYNGEVFLQVLNLAAGEGGAAVNAEFVLGRQANGGSIVYTIFTSDGTSAGTAYAFAANEISTDVAFTAARVATALGNVNIRYQQYTAAIGQQALGNA